MKIQAYRNLPSSCYSPLLHHSKWQVILKSIQQLNKEAGSQAKNLGQKGIIILENIPQELHSLALNSMNIKAKTHLLNSTEPTLCPHFSVFSNCPLDTQLRFLESLPQQQRKLALASISGKHLLNLFHENLALIFYQSCSAPFPNFPQSSLANAFPQDFLSQLFPFLFSSSTSIDHLAFSLQSQLPANWYFMLSNKHLCQRVCRLLPLFHDLEQQKRLSKGFYAKLLKTLPPHHYSLFNQYATLDQNIKMFKLLQSNNSLSIRQLLNSYIHSLSLNQLKFLFAYFQHPLIQNALLLYLKNSSNHCSLFSSRAFSDRIE